MLDLDRITPAYLVGVDNDRRTYVRITVGPVSNVRRVRFGRFLAEAEEYAKAEFGSGITELLNNEDPEIVAMAETLMVRGGMMAALRKFEIGTQDGENPIAWAEADLPDQWATPAGFADNVPSGLIHTWYAATMATNAGLFYVSPDPAQKKSEPSNATA